MASLTFQGGRTPDSEVVRRKTRKGVKEWLNYVQQRYIAGDTLEYLKFSFRGDEPLIVNRMEDVKNLPELYHLMKEVIYKDDEKKALSRMVYTLDLVGHRRFGKRAVAALIPKQNKENEIVPSRYDVSPPEPYDPSKDELIVQLYHCLTQIASRLSVGQEKRMRQHYADLDRINPNAPIAETILSLFGYLVQTKMITIDDQLNLARALKEAEAGGYFKYLMEYRDRNPELEHSRDEYIAIFPAYDPADFVSSITGETPRSSPSSEDYASAVSHRSRRTSRPNISDQIYQERSATHVTPSPNSVVQEQGTPNERTPLVPRVDRNDQAQQHDQDPPDRPKPVGWPVKSLVCVFALVAVAVVALLGIAGSGYGTYSALVHNYTQQTVWVYGNSTIALVDNLAPFYLDGIDLEQNLVKNYHDIDLYLIESSCHKLNTTSKTVSYSLIDQGSIRNITGQYLLPGSKITYSICATTNSRKKEHEIDIKVFVVNNSLDVVHNSVKKYNAVPLPDQYNIPEFDFPACYVNQSEICLCKLIEFEIHDRGYYSMQFALNHPEVYSSMSYTYNLSIHQEMLVAPSADNTLDSCSLYEIVQRPCKFLINGSLAHLPQNMNYKQCIFADIHNRTDPDDIEAMEFSRVHIKYTPYYINWFALSVSFLGASGLIFFVVIVIEVVVICCLCRKRKCC